MKKDNENDILFVIRHEDLQNEAMQRIGRKLTEEETLSASKGIEAGLLLDIDTVFATAIDEAVNNF